MQTELAEMQAQMDRIKSSKYSLSRARDRPAKPGGGGGGGGGGGSVAGGKYSL